MDRKTYIPAFLTLACVAAILAMKKKRDDVATLLNNKYDMSSNSNLPRGYRNNNPLNIRLAKNNWLGKVLPNTDGAFEQFTSMPYGYRAALYLLRKYIKQGYNLIGMIINRWAPPSENNTNKYIDDVCTIMQQRTGKDVTPFDTVSINDADTLCEMAYAMSIIENGNNEITRAAGLPNMNAIKEGWNLL